MSARSQVVGAALVGVAVGACAFLGWRLVVADDDGEAGPGQTSTTAASVEVEAPWIEGGVRYETTVIVPLSFSVAQGVAELVYRAETISPALSREDDGGDAGTPPDVIFRPETWIIELAGSGPVTATTDPDAGRVRFTVPEGATSDDVLGVHVVGWRWARLVGSSVTLPLERDATGTFGDGTELTMRTVLDQATSTIIQVDVEAPDLGDWHPVGPVARADDARWRLSGGIVGGDFQMTWEGDDAPDAITLIQNYPVWEPVAARVTIIDQGGA
jgi:hypothetical protein